VNGKGTIAWNQRDLRGKLVANGLYYFRLVETGQSDQLAKSSSCVEPVLSKGSFMDESGMTFCLIYGLKKKPGQIGRKIDKAAPG